MWKQHLILHILVLKCHHRSGCKNIKYDIKAGVQIFQTNLMYLNFLIISVFESAESFVFQVAIQKFKD